MIKNNITAFKIFDDLHTENLIITKVILKKINHLILINTYIPNENYLKNKAFDNLEYVIYCVFQKYVNPSIEICGDYNQDLRHL